jgi:hypothetical protein
MAILDCMLLNALNMWNLSVDKVPLCRKMKRFKFLQPLANELLHYKTEGRMSPQTERNHQAPVAMERGAMIGNGHTIVMSTKTIRCIVCSLELSQLEQLAKKNQGQRGMVLAEQLARAYHGVRKQVSYCTECGVGAHNCLLPRENKKNIHYIFPGQTCMDIVHSPMGKEICSINNSGGHWKVTVHRKHPIVEEVKNYILKINYFSHQLHL